MTLFLASSNAHKFEEMRVCLPGVDIQSPASVGVEAEFEESAPDFIGNSLGKAIALWRKTGKPTLADDSGLVVDALGGRPGVLSARYGSPDGTTPLDARARNALLLAEMEGVADRRCRFVCCMSLVLSPDRFFVAQETCEGVLLEEPRGGGGFGYDPIVFLPELGRSVAELTQEEKSAVSHRGRAARRIAAVIAGL